MISKFSFTALRHWFEVLPKWIWLLVVVGVVGGTFLIRHRVTPASPAWETFDFATLTVGSRRLTVEIAATPAKTTQGLSDRTEIGSDGMLFVFQPAQRVDFWMKDMKFNLDLVWIRQDQIQVIQTNLPKPLPNQPDSSLPRYSSPGKVNMVLELPAGQAQKLDLSPGQTIQVTPQAL